MHVHFGNIALLLSHVQLADFSDYITEAMIAQQGVEDHNDRSICLPTRDCALMFVLSFNEMKHLSEILKHTLLLINIDERSLN